MIQRIGIWGHYHGDNLGDDIVVATIAASFRRRISDVEVIGYSLRPEDTARRHGIPAYAILVGLPRPLMPPTIGDSEGDGAPSKTRTESGQSGGGRTSASPKSKLKSFLGSIDNPVVKAARRWKWRASSLWQMRRSLRDVDVLVVAGSGPFYDGWDGAWNHPFNLFRWSQLARTTGTKFMALSVGGGPIDERITQFFLRQTVRSASYTSYRDPYSANLARTLGAQGPYPTFPDLAFGIHPTVLQRARAEVIDVAGNHRAVVGISTVAHQDPRYMPRGSQKVFRPFLKKLIDVTGRLLDEGFTPVFLRSDRADDLVAEDIVQALQSEGRNVDSIVIPPTETHEDLLAQIAACDVVIGGRFHCHVLPMLFGVPVLGLAYHPKTSDMMGYMGQGDHVLDIDRCQPDDVLHGVEKLLADRDAISQELLERTALCREAVSLQFDAIVDGTVDALHGSYLPEHEPVPPVAAR